MTGAQDGVHIEAVGVFCERFDCFSALAVEGALGETPAQMPANIFEPLRPRPKHLNTIDREDRSLLNPVSILVVNAVDDALAHLPAGCGREDFAEAPIFIGADGAEHNFSALNAVVRETGTGETVYAHLGELRDRVNPLDMLRALTTAPAYHASKRLRTHGGAYPLFAASLGGLVALEEASIQLAQGPRAAACVIGAGNMRSFDSLVTFRKLGLIAEQGGPGIVPSFGAACLLLRRRSVEDKSLAHVLASRTLYMPEEHPGADAWRSLYTNARDAHGDPDVIVSYAAGAPAMDHAEQGAIAAAFPSVPVRNYKHAFGYTGKANNLLDLAAALADPANAPGAKILIGGAGLGYGLGYLLIEKADHG